MKIEIVIFLILKMGLTWSSGKLVKNETMIVKQAVIPQNKEVSGPIWDLWNKYKEEIRKDNFSIKKYDGIWRVSYFHDITENSMQVVDGTRKWEKEFEEKLEKYKLLASEV